MNRSRYFFLVVGFFCQPSVRLFRYLCLLAVVLFLRDCCLVILNPFCLGSSHYGILAAANIHTFNSTPSICLLHRNCHKSSEMNKTLFDMCAFFKILCMLCVRRNSQLFLVLLILRFLLCWIRLSLLASIVTIGWVCFLGIFFYCCSTVLHLGLIQFVVVASLFTNTNLSCIQILLKRFVYFM